MNFSCFMSIKLHKMSRKNIIIMLFRDVFVLRLVINSILSFLLVVIYVKKRRKRMKNAQKFKISDISPQLL